jgi:hypothetical protein
MDIGTGQKVVRRDKILTSAELRNPDRLVGSPVTIVITEFRQMLHPIDWSPFRRFGQSRLGVLDAKEDGTYLHLKVSNYSQRTLLKR